MGPFIQHQWKHGNSTKAMNPMWAKFFDLVKANAPGGMDSLGGQFGRPSLEAMQGQVPDVAENGASQVSLQAFQPRQFGSVGAWRKPKAKVKYTAQRAQTDSPDQ